MTRRNLISGLLAVPVVLCVTPIAQARADENRKNRGESDHDDALRARESGTVLSLPEILTIVTPKITGEIIDTKFEYEHGVPVYEFKYVSPSGRVRELYADARSGKILKDKRD